MICAYFDDNDSDITNDKLSYRINKNDAESWFVDYYQMDSKSKIILLNEDCIE